MLSSLYSLGRLFGDHGPRAVAAGNATSTVRLSTNLGDMWKAYEGLPLPIRQAIAEANINLCPHKIGALYRTVLAEAMRLGLEHHAIELYLERFDEAQNGEIAMFSDNHHALYGRQSPHVLAEATRLTETARPRRSSTRRRR